MKNQFENLFGVSVAPSGIDAASARNRDESPSLDPPRCEREMDRVGVEGCGEAGAAAPDDIQLIEQGLRLLGENARARARRDYSLGVDIVEGGLAFLRDGASEGELTVYNHQWVRECLFAIVGKSEYAGDAEVVQ